MLGKIIQNQKGRYHIFFHALYSCVCVCVRASERERERKKVFKMHTGVDNIKVECYILEKRKETSRAE